MITFIPLQKSHFPLLLKWLCVLHVEEWWSEQEPITEQFVTQKYETYVEGYKANEAGDRKPIFAFVICYDDTPIGYIQYYDVRDFGREEFESIKNFLPLRCAALDFYLGESSFLGKGLGAEVLRLFLKECISQNFDACYVDPEKENVRALATYKKAGFTQIGSTAKIVHFICRPLRRNEPGA